MKKLSWVAAGIACVLVAGAWIRAVERVDQDRREAVEDALRVGSALASAYEEAMATRLDALRMAGRHDELAAAIASARAGVALAAPGATHTVQVVPASEPRRLRGNGYLYSFRNLVEYPVTVVVGVAESTVMAAAQRRRSDHYLVAFLESVLAVVATLAVVRHAWRAVSGQRRLDELAAAGWRR